jgi:hypothetical protein
MDQRGAGHACGARPGRAAAGARACVEIALPPGGGLVRRGRRRCRGGISGASAAAAAQGFPRARRPAPSGRPCGAAARRHARRAPPPPSPRPRPPPPWAGGASGGTGAPARGAGRGPDRPARRATRPCRVKGRLPCRQRTPGAGGQRDQTRGRPLSHMPPRVGGSRGGEAGRAGRGVARAVYMKGGGGGGFGWDQWDWLCGRAGARAGQEAAVRRTRRTAAAPPFSFGRPPRAPGGRSRRGLTPPTPLPSLSREQARAGAAKEATHRKQTAQPDCGLGKGARGGEPRRPALPHLGANVRGR